MRDDREDTIAVLSALRAFARSLCLHSVYADKLVATALELKLDDADGKADITFRLQKAVYDVYKRNRLAGNFKLEIPPKLGVSQPQTYAILQEVLSALSNEQRETLVMVHGARLSYLEVAKIFEISEFSVMQLMTSASETLKPFFARAEELDVEVRPEMTAQQTTAYNLGLFLSGALLDAHTSGKLIHS